MPKIAENVACVESGIAKGGLPYGALATLILLNETVF